MENKFLYKRISNYSETASDNSCSNNKFIRLSTLKACNLQWLVCGPWAMPDSHADVASFYQHRNALTLLVVFLTVLNVISWCNWVALCLAAYLVHRHSVSFRSSCHFPPNFWNFLHFWTFLVLLHIWFLHSWQDCRGWLFSSKFPKSSLFWHFPV